MPSYYTCEGTLYNISTTPFGSPEMLTQQGINIGDNLSFTIMIDFSRAGEYTLNNGTVVPYTEGLFNFYADLIDAPQVEPIDGGYYNDPLSRLLPFYIITLPDSGSPAVSSLILVIVFRNLYCMEPFQK